MLSAVVHLDLWANGMNTLAVVGPAFLLNGVGGLVLGVLVLVWRHWLPLLGAIGFGVATLTAFLISTTPGGFFGVHEQWVGIPVWLSAISEIGAIVLGSRRSWWNAARRSAAATVHEPSSSRRS